MEGKRGKKVFRHPFADRRPVEAAVLFAVFGLLFSELAVGGIAAGIFAAVTGNREDLLLVSELGGAAGAFIVLALFRRFFYPEYVGGLRGGFRTGFWILVSLAVSAAFLLYTALFPGKGGIGLPAAVNLAAALMAGTAEEAAVRGMSASFLMRQRRGEKGILFAMFLSSAVISLFHALNILEGAPASMTLLQIVYSFGIGCLFCALFLRCGNLLPGMILHTFNDIAAFMDRSSFGEGGAYKSSTGLTASGAAEGAVLSLLFLAAALWLIRPSVRGEIAELWDRKWGR